MKGPYDVDNMGSGTADSIWIDPGFPVMTARDGRTYKVLVAPLIIDLDGRVNINAQGSYAQLDPNYQGMSTGPLAGGAGGVALPPGMGWGPGDVNLQKVINSQELFNLFGMGSGNPTSQANTSGGGNATTQGRHGYGVSPTSNRPLMNLKAYDAPPSDFRFPPLTAYGTPGDWKGRRTVGLDYRGQPLFITPGSNPTNTNYWNNELFDFSAAHFRDRDRQSLRFRYFAAQCRARGGRCQCHRSKCRRSTIRSPWRSSSDSSGCTTSIRFHCLRDLYTLLKGTVTSTPAQINQMTPESWDVPVPAFAVPRDLRTAMTQKLSQSRAFNLSDLVRAKLSGTAVAANAMDAEIAKILPPEMVAGLRMDINRPLGNGRADGATGAVDYSGSLDGTTVKPDSGNSVEAISNATSAFWPPAPFPTSVPFNLTNSVTDKSGARSIRSWLGS